MRVATYYNNNDVRIEEIPKPGIYAGEILVKVIASGICGSDVMEWYRLKKAPRVLGHEMTGEIVEVGKGVKKYKPGDRVFVSHHVPCNKCNYCKSGHHTACETLHTTNFYPGGFSEYVKVPALNVKTGVYILPKNISYEEGTIIEPLACVIRGQRLAGVGKNQSALIMGSGISGLLHIKLAKAKGAKRIVAVDVNEYRLKFAKKFGADETFKAGKKINEKFDRVIVCTGAESAVLSALDCVDRGGVILYFAVPKPEFRLPLPINDLWRNEVTIMTSYGATPNDLSESLRLIASGKIKVRDMITHVLPLTEAQKGFKLVAEAKESVKVILKPFIL